MTWGSICILIGLAAIVAAIITSMVRDRKKGKSSCGGNCASCPHCVHSLKNT